MIRCSSCDQENPMNANFCETCGNSFAELQSQLREADEDALRGLKTQQGRAWKALAVVAVLQVFVGLLGMRRDEFDPDPDLTQIAIIIVGAMFMALAVVAWFRPLAGAIMGLILFVGLHAAEAVADPTTIFSGLLTKIIVIVVLGAAVQAGMRHRRYLQKGWLD